jgi:lysophospholipid acyltransferase (LPLAT)-like uncharacterized protein
MMSGNLTGVWKSAKALAPHMIERQRGSIAITSSMNGLEPGLNYARYFEQFGFTRIRQVGTQARIVSRVVDPV